MIKQQRPKTHPTDTRRQTAPRVLNTTQLRSDGHVVRVCSSLYFWVTGVGKSSFIQRCCTGHFSKMSATVGMDFQMKTLTLRSTPVTLQLWDTAGQERFRSITEQYYRKADGVLAMYDVTEPSSFAAVRGWITSVKEKMCEGAVLMLLGNKLDLAHGEANNVTMCEGQRLAELGSTRLCFTSAVLRRVIT